MSGVSSLLLSALTVVISVNSARILAVYPTPSLSHHFVFRPFTAELARKGHEVVVITTDPAYPKGEEPNNLIEIDIHEPSYEKWREVLREVMSHHDNLTHHLKIYLKSLMQLFQMQINIKEVKDIIDKKYGEFDLIIAAFSMRPALAFSHIFKAPLIQISTLGPALFNDEELGAYSHPIVFPSPWHKKTYNLTIWEEMQKMWDHWDLRSYYKNLEKEEDKMLKAEFGPHFPTINELKDNIALLFLNVHPVWAENQPVAPNMVYVGGIQQKPEKKLPKVF